MHVRYEPFTAPTAQHGTAVNYGRDAGRAAAARDLKDGCRRPRCRPHDGDGMMALGAPDRQGRDVAVRAEAVAASAKAPVREPMLDQLLAEPIVQQVMRHDQTDRANIRQLLREVAAVRIGRGPKHPVACPNHPPLAAAISSWPPHGVHWFLKLVAILFAVFPAFLCAWLADRSGRWDLFERAGSIATTIGLVFASGRYVRHSVLELAVSRSGQRDSSLAEVLDEVIGARIGFALSGFGTLVWGWGAYLRWWSFLYLPVWGLVVARTIHRYRRTLRRSGAA